MQQDIEEKAQKGDLQAQAELGRYFLDQESYPQAKFWLEKAAMQNDASSQYLLGNMYVNGLDGEPNYTLAREWIQKAAEQRNVDAMVDLSSFYQDGTGGCEISPEKEKYWLEQAAILGDEEAQLELGLIFQAEENMESAKKWFEEAFTAYQSDRAAYFLGRLYLENAEEKATKELAYDWLKKAVDLGNANALGFLAKLQATEMWRDIEDTQGF
ncbi:MULTISPECIES: tetratricopeptide repeat protein [Parachlamydia]|uniref:Uncharacterized protein YbeT n=1 Tax=Parachlamydia acanthamoebae TaxID=83552 RepID=A0A0C1C8X8_9BACT|nr:tetratricopeptide repeat protein [Parachlamydia acanthamoebae]KIA77490.1 Uncharacterized protein YbeT [Parachlamydia acanthamoebae]